MTVLRSRQLLTMATKLFMIFSVILINVSTFATESINGENNDDNIEQLKLQNILHDLNEKEAVGSDKRSAMYRFQKKEADDDDKRSAMYRFQKKEHLSNSEEDLDKEPDLDKRSAWYRFHKRLQNDYEGTDLDEKRSGFYRFNRAPPDMKRSGWYRFNRGFDDLKRSGWYRFNRALGDLKRSGWYRSNRGMGDKHPDSWYRFHKRTYEDDNLDDGIGLDSSEDRELRSGWYRFNKKDDSTEDEDDMKRNAAFRFSKRFELGDGDQELMAPEVPDGGEDFKRDWITRNKAHKHSSWYRLH